MVLSMTTSPHMPENPLAAETIAAIATAAGTGGIGIVRLSGPEASTIASTITGDLPAPRNAHHTNFLDERGAVIDEGLVIFFKAPHSFTGEDVVELHGHGGPVVMDLLLNRCLGLGARLARAGEFSERAFLNGKIDLTQAEAIADLISAGSAQAARSAVRALKGEFAARIHGLTEQVLRLRVHVEAAMDFPEEEIDFMADPVINESLDGINTAFDETLAKAEQGRLLREGFNIVLAGPPNAGKSSLLNALAGMESAIVSDTPGTTRDIVREHINLDGLPIHVLDTAGLRDDSSDAIEAEGMRRARAAMREADRVLLIVDASAIDSDRLEQMIAALPDGVLRTVIRNKIDLVDNKGEYINTKCYKELSVSAKTGVGMDLLREHLKEIAGFHPASEGGFIARRRHLDALNRARTCCRRAAKRLEENKAGELVAEELRLAQDALGEITGEVTSEDLLGEIFSSFCIGK